MIWCNLHFLGWHTLLQTIEFQLCSSLSQSDVLLQFYYALILHMCVSAVSQFDMSTQLIMMFICLAGKRRSC